MVITQRFLVIHAFLQVNVLSLFSLLRLPRIKKVVTVMWLIIVICLGHKME